MFSLFFLDCGYNYFHSFNCDYVCDIQFANIENEKISFKKFFEVIVIMIIEE